MLVHCFGIPAPLNKAIGIVNNTMNSAQKKLKSQGFWMECLLVSFPVTASTPNIKEAAQANIEEPILNKLYYNNQIGVSFCGGVLLE